METDLQHTEPTDGDVQLPEPDTERMRTRFEQLAGIGADPAGGWSRLAYSASEEQARLLVMSWLSDMGLRPRVDAAGNVWGRYPVDRPGPAVVTGSHVDTVPRGGCWDGALGVVAGGEAIAALAVAQTPLASPVEVVAFAAEESPRFSQAAYRFGSRALVGDIETDAAGALTDSDGITLSAAMSSVGLDLALIGDARIDVGG